MNSIHKTMLCLMLLNSLVTLCMQQNDVKTNTLNNAMNTQENLSSHFLSDQDIDQLTRDMQETVKKLKNIPSICTGYFWATIGYKKDSTLPV